MANLTPGVMTDRHSILTFSRSRADTVTTARRLSRSVAGPVTTILFVGRHCFTSDLGFLRRIWFSLPLEIMIARRFPIPSLPIPPAFPSDAFRCRTLSRQSPLSSIRMCVISSRARVVR